jgi:hypothetical protein
MILEKYSIDGKTWYSFDEPIYSNLHLGWSLYEFCLTALDHDDIRSVEVKLHGKSPENKIFTVIDVFSRNLWEDRTLNKGYLISDFLDEQIPLLMSS